LILNRHTAYGVYGRFADTYNCIKTTFHDTDILADIGYGLYEVNVAYSFYCKLTRNFVCANTLKNVVTVQTDGRTDGRTSL